MQYSHFSLLQNLHVFSDGKTLSIKNRYSWINSFSFSKMNSISQKEKKSLSKINFIKKKKEKVFKKPKKTSHLRQLPLHY